MLISHKHKLIFVKPRKVGGTTMQYMLARFAGDDAIVSPIHKPPRDYRVRNIRVLQDAWPSRIEHIAAVDLRSLLERHLPGCWDAYYKIALERNPWDFAVSMWYWVHRKGRRSRFKSWLFSDKFPGRDNIDMYTADNEVIVDHVIRLEDLEWEWPALCERLNVPCEPLCKLNVCKTPGRRHYSTYYDEEDEEFVERRFLRTINLHGYKF